MSNIVNIPEIPTTTPPEMVDFLRSLSQGLSVLQGLGRNSEMDKALRISDLSRLGIVTTDFLRATSENPLSIGSAEPSGAAPLPPQNLIVTKGPFVHVLTFDIPDDPIVDYIEVWVAKNSQLRTNAKLGFILTVKDYGSPGLIKMTVDDVTADYTYWIRSVSFARNHSIWEPPDSQGGYVVPGDESIGETIDGVLNILKGTDPDLYNASTVYSLFELCKTSDGRRWKSVSVTDFSGQSPPNATYWERAGILMQGEVDGVDTVGIDGNLVVDSTIMARHIQAGSITAGLLAAGQVLIGHTIQSSNYVSGTSGWKIDKSGSAEFIGGTFTITGGLDYTKVSGTKPPAEADKTSSNTANNAANYTGNPISTSYTAAKCTNALADQTRANTAYDTDRVNAMAATTLISGGYIGTNLVNANSIYAGSITAAKMHVDAMSTCKFYCSDSNTTGYDTYKNFTKTSVAVTALAGFNYGTGSFAIGISGSSSGNASAIGILGGCSAGTGVKGSSSSGSGVWGYASTTGSGVIGQAVSNWGVEGITGNASHYWGVGTDDKMYAAEGYSPFTGSHLCFSKENLTVGDIVIAGHALLLSISEAFPIIATTTKKCAASVIGVMSCADTEGSLIESDLFKTLQRNKRIFDKKTINERIKVCEKDNPDQGLKVGDEIVENDGYEYVLKEKHRTNESSVKNGMSPAHPSSFGDIIENNNYRMFEVNALGEGAINVCSEGGDILAGDYICSSSIPGKGMKQADDLLHNYTVAKALENVVWADELNNIKMIACTYHCG